MSDTPNLDGLEVYDPNRRIDCQKPATRVQEVKAERKLTVVDEKTFKKQVHARDGFICRCCKRKVEATLSRVPERREVHHLHGRRGDLRFEWRAALVVCLECHEKLTGKVNEKWIAIPTKTFTLHDREYTDARAPVIFQRAA